MMEKSLKIVTFIVFFSVVFAGTLFADVRGAFTIRNDRKIDVQINNLPMSEALKDLAAKIPLEFKGISVGNEIITLNLSSVSLEEILKRLMRGYNYVVIKPESSEKTIVMVLGRAERTKYTAPPPQVDSATEKRVSAPSVAPPPAITPKPSSDIKPPSSGAGSHTTTASPDTSGATAPIVTSEQSGISASQKDATQKIVMDASLMPPVPPVLPGHDLPPTPPGMTDTTASTTPTTTGTTTATGTTGTTTTTGTITTPPSNQTTTTTKPGEPDLRPPQVPF